jgi:hypothetical protein
MKNAEPNENGAALLLTHSMLGHASLGKLAGVRSRGSRTERSVPT